MAPVQAIQIASAVALSQIAATSSASAAQYLCEFSSACLLEAADQCDDTNEMIFVRTPPDSFVSQGFSDLDIGIVGDTDLMGTPGILPGAILPASSRLNLPDRLRRASTQINMAERIEQLESEAYIVSVAGPKVVLTPTEMITTPTVQLNIAETMEATFTVEGSFRVNMMYRGSCEVTQ